MDFRNYTDELFAYVTVAYIRKNQSMFIGTHNIPYTGTVTAVSAKDARDFLRDRGGFSRIRLFNKIFAKTCVYDSNGIPFYFPQRTHKICADITEYIRYLYTHSIAAPAAVQIQAAFRGWQARRRFNIPRMRIMCQLKCLPPIPKKNFSGGILYRAALRRFQYYSST